MTFRDAEQAILGEELVKKYGMQLDELLSHETVGLLIWLRQYGLMNKESLRRVAEIIGKNFHYITTGQR